MEIMLTSVTYADWKRIIQVAVKQAMRGDNQARKFLADYIIGTPPQRHEHSGRDGEAIPLQINEIIVKAPREPVDD